MKTCKPNDRKFTIAAGDDDALLKTFRIILDSEISVSNMIVNQPSLEEAFTNLVRRNA